MRHKKIIRDSAIFILSLSVSWWLIKSGRLENLVEAILPLRFVAEIMAGIFYTSFFTSPISVAMLIILAQHNNPIITALLAGTGAVLGDLLVIKFIREKLSYDLNLVSRELQLQKLNRFLQKFKLDFLIPLVGAIIVASPFPDELGLMILGASKLKYHQIALLTYILNTAGILLIVTSVNLLS